MISMVSRGSCGELGGVAWAVVALLPGVSLAWRGSSWVWNLCPTSRSGGGVVGMVIFGGMGSLGVEGGERGGNEV